MLQAMIRTIIGCMGHYRENAVFPMKIKHVVRHKPVTGL
jgi:hypothetical protein